MFYVYPTLLHNILLPTELYNKLDFTPNMKWPHLNLKMLKKPTIFLKPTPSNELQLLINDDANVKIEV